MAVRWYISRVLGTGTANDPYRLAVADLPITSHAAVIASNPDGTPARQWGLVRVSAGDFSALDASADSELVADDLREALVSSIPPARRARIAAAASQLGLTLTVGQGPLDPAGKLRVLLRALGRALDNNFAEDGLG